MVHNEAEYIEEWVAYHMLLNVDHMYIYNDMSNDNIHEVLAPYVNQGFVSIIQWNKTMQTVDSVLVASDPPYTRSQRFGLADCVYNHASESEWFGIWDVDEFIVLNNSYPDIVSFLQSIEGSLDNYLIPLTVFGSSGYEKTPAGFVIENYQWRSNDTIFGFNDKTNKFSGKSLYKSQCAAPSVHFTTKLEDGCKQHYSGWVRAEGDSSYLPISLNHYATKSWEHFIDKMKKWNWGVSEDTKKQVLDNDNNYYDERMTKFVNPLKELVGCMAQFK